LNKTAAEQCHIWLQLQQSVAGTVWQECIIASFNLFQNIKI